MNSCPYTVDREFIAKSGTGRGLSVGSLAFPNSVCSKSDSTDYIMEGDQSDDIDEYKVPLLTDGVAMIILRPGSWQDCTHTSAHHVGRVRWPPV